MSVGNWHACVKVNYALWTEACICLKVVLEHTKPAPPSVFSPCCVFVGWMFVCRSSSVGVSSAIMSLGLRCASLKTCESFATRDLRSPCRDMGGGGGWWVLHRNQPFTKMHVWVCEPVEPDGSYLSNSIQTWRGQKTVGCLSASKRTWSKYKSLLHYPDSFLNVLRWFQCKLYITQVCVRWNSGL